VAGLSDQQKEQLNKLGLRDTIGGCRVLLTGATGFVGRHLCEALLDLGADVFALSRSSKANDGLSNKVHELHVDLKSLKATRKAIETAHPELVYHLAGLVDTRQNLSLVMPTFANNLSASVHLFVALAEIGCDRVVVVGSSEEPDVSRYGVSANSPYAAAKDASTAYARMFHKVFSLPVVITRPFMSYGPRQPINKIIPYTITSILEEKHPKISSGRRICDLIYVCDLTMGLLLSGFKSGLLGEMIDLGTGIGTTIHDAVQLVVKLLNSHYEPVFGAIPDRLYEFPQVADAEKTADLLGFRPIWSLEQGLKETIDWYCKL
jgi:UDP-glucose 4-epimerase